MFKLKLPSYQSVFSAFLITLFILMGSLAYQRIAYAAPSDIEVTIIAAPNLVVDSNVMSPSTQAPEVATVIGKFCNKSGGTLNNVMGYIGDYNPSTPANSTPGMYPAKTDVTIGGQFYSGTYRFTHLGGTGDAVRIIGTLAPGACSYQYWSFSYPRKANGGTIPAWGSSVKPIDDLSLDFDIWAGEGSTICNVSSCNKTHTATMRNEISAMANKIEPNGNPGGQWFNTNSQVVQVGETITTNGILYRLGNVNKGFDNNGDLVPDYNAWLQPIGNPTYDPSCFRLIESSGVLTVTRSSGNPDLIIPFSHQLNQSNNAPLLYFTDLPPDNTDVRGLVYYTFMALGGPCTIPISPYQEVASGSDNEKFNGDYGGGGPGTIESFPPSLSLDKNGPTSVSEGGASFTYTIPFQNTGSSSMGLSLSSGMSAGFVISDTVPTGLQYVGGSAASGNTVPAGNGFTIYYSTNSGATWSQTDPGTVTSTGPNSLVMVQWWLNEPLTASASGAVTFQAQVPTGYITGGGTPFIENCAGAQLGTGKAFSTACKTTMVNGTASIGDLVWSDNGTGAGGITNNGRQDGTEAGINNIGVKLYWDKNGNGTLEATDVLVGSKDTATISGTSNYLFSSLPAGKYVVTVDTADNDLPVGFGPTTPSSFAITLTAGQAFTTADFGFGPSLSLTKKLNTLTPAYVGENVTFQIDLVNNLPGDGTANGFCKYTLWATVQPPADNIPASGSGNSAWQNIPSILGKPDGKYGYTIMANNADDVGLSGFNIYGQTGSITSVNLLAYVRETKKTQSTQANYLTFEVFRNNTVAQTLPFSSTFFTGPAGTDYVINQALSAPSGGWQWSHFQNNFSELRAIGNDTGSPASRGDVGIDAIAYVITTNRQCGGAATTITELPLTDTYDPTYLQFVSASPAPSSQSSGTITWNNLGPLYAGGTKTVTVTFKALAQVASTTNTATSTNGKFGTGRTVNNATSNASVPINAPGNISGVVWAETNAANQWTSPTGYDGSDGRIAGVSVQLYACYAFINSVWQPHTTTTAATNRDCAHSDNNGTWVLLSTQLTASDGSYSFTGLRPGYYNVKVVEATLPTGFTTRTGDPSPAGNGAGSTCPTCDSQWNTDAANLSTFNDLASGESITAVSFGYRDPDGQGALTGYVWNDRNSNGVWDAGEEPIPNVSVYLCTTSPCNSATAGAILATTSNDGRYTFGNLNAGTYYVGVTTPSGMSQSGDPDVPGANCSASCDNQTAAITIAAREVKGPYNFGYTGGLTIGDTIFTDWNGNGSQDSGEEGLSGVQVQLYRDLNGNGVVDTGDTLLSTQTTNASGFYQFTNLAGNGNKYLVRVVTSTLPAGYVQTADPDEVGTCVTCDNKQVVTLNASSVNTADFGYKPTGFSSIGDFVWSDLDGDGIQDPGEAGINGATVRLYQDQNGDGFIDTAADAVVATVTTNASGGYIFTGLPAGNYIVEIPQSNFSSGQPLAGLTMTTTGTPYNNTATQVSYKVSLGVSQVFTDADFGFAQGLIGDLIWRDNNGNGTPDPGEPGIDGVTVTLFVWNDDGDGVIEPGEKGASLGSKVTAGGGRYEFGSLKAGKYIVEVTPPANHALTGDPDAYGLNGFLTPPCNPADTTNYAFCDNQYGVQLLAGQTDRTADFGYQPRGVIGDTLWIDGNGDGIRNVGEAGIPFVTVYLCTSTPCSSGNATATTETDSDGYYSFGAVADNTYYVAVNIADTDFPAGLSQTYDPDVANPCSGGSCDNTGTSTITGGSVDLTRDFGYRFVGTNTINGTVWHDNDSNQSIGGSETVRFENVTVYLWNCGTGTCNDGDEKLAGTTTTDASGFYQFTNLANGNYAVVVNKNATNLSGLTPTTVTTYTNVNLTGGSTQTRNFGFVSGMDFGDLPSTYFNTLAMHNGARHSTGSVYLGVGVDADANGKESPTATGDTDDGVTRSGSWSNGANGAAVNVVTTCPGAPCYLSAWIDWNGDGDFLDSGERVMLDRPVVNGSNAITFNVPSGTFPGFGSNSTFNIRFRLYAGSTGGFAQPTGLVTNGEVEDYQWSFAPTAITLKSLSAHSASSASWIVIASALLLGGLVFFMNNKNRIVEMVKTRSTNRH